jgi:hypothetical protein
MRVADIRDDGRMNERDDGRMDVRDDGGMDGRDDGRMNVREPMAEWMCDWSVLIIVTRMMRLL